LLLQAGGAVTQLDAGGIMIGVLPDPEFPEQSVQLGPGDKVLFYTDGLTECPDASGTLFGVERVQECLSRHRRLDCDQLIARLVDEVRGFSKSGEFADDLTVVLLEVQDKS
jgi:sigma-B regulation protein RsbU (phosphoserine phosphatase)